MRQFLILLCFFSCASVLADHDGSEGYSYNGRTFQCKKNELGFGGYDETKKFAEIYDTGVAHYNYALCQLHHGPKHFMAGIASLQTAASKGFHAAAIVLAGYFSSDGYDLPKREVTENVSNLQKTIEYRELALQSIHDQSNYPFNSLDNLEAEREDHLYLNTASNLTGSYLSLFGARISDHIESTNKNIGNTTLEPLKKAIKAANDCIAISPNENIWSSSVYNNNMARCRADKKTAQEILLLEEKRLRVASSTSCRNIKLSDCEVHNEIESQIYQLYVENLEATDNLIAAL